MDLRATDGLGTTLMNAILMLTTVVFMHPKMTLSAPTCAVVWRDSKAMDGLVMISTNARLTHMLVVFMHPAITLLAPTFATV